MQFSDASPGVALTPGFPSKFGGDPLLSSEPNKPGRSGIWNWLEPFSGESLGNDICSHTYNL